jgi:hypothetical protein
MVTPAGRRARSATAPSRYRMRESALAIAFTALRILESRQRIARKRRPGAGQR